MPKRRSKGDGALYKRADGMWVGAVTFDVPGEGRKRKTVSSRDKATAQRKLRELVRHKDAHGTPPAASMTVAAWMDKWLAEIAPARVRARTLTGYRSYVETWIKPYLGRYRLDRLNADHVRALYRAMDDAGRTEATKRQCFAILHRALKVAVNEGHMLSNPAAIADRPKTIQNHRTPLTLAQAHAVFACLEGDPLASRWLVALLQGLRQGEALGLRWEDVDLVGGDLYVVRAIQRVTGRGLVEVPPKSDASHRVVPLLAPVAYALTQHRAATGGVGYVWGGDKPLDPRRDYEAWREVLDRAGVPRRPLHAARATTGSLLNAARVPTEIVAEILGHAHVQVTRDSYIKGSKELHRRAMDDLNSYVAIPQQGHDGSSFIPPGVATNIES